MELLQERIRREGRVLPGNIVKVDGFLNTASTPVCSRTLRTSSPSISTPARSPLF